MIMKDMKVMPKIRGINCKRRLRIYLFILFILLLYGEKSRKIMRVL